MKVIRKEHKLCLHCMEEHEVLHARIMDKNVYKGQEVTYAAIYEYCANADEFWANEAYLTQNDSAMKAAYQKALLLTKQD